MVTVNHWTDRIYQNTQQEHVISNVVSGRKMKMIKYNMPDTGRWTIYHFKITSIYLSTVLFFISHMESMGCNIKYYE
jgi:hypothetical protein